MIKLTVLISSIIFSISAKKNSKKDGLDLFLVGDFGSMYDMRAANLVFDAMDNVKKHGNKCADEAKEG